MIMMGKKTYGKRDASDNKGCDITFCVIVFRQLFNSLLLLLALLVFSILFWFTNTMIHFFISSFLHFFLSMLRVFLSCPDDKALVMKLREYFPSGPYGILIFNDSSEHAAFDSATDTHALKKIKKDLTFILASEINPNCSGKHGTRNCKDNTIDKVISLLSTNGYAR